MTSTPTGTCPRDRRRPLRLGIAAVVLLAAVMVASPASAQVLSPTEVPTEAPSPTAMGGACDVSFGPADWICDRGLGSATQVVTGTAESALRAVAAAVVDGAAWLLEQLAGIIDSATRPDLTAGWFEDAYRNMAAVAVFGLLPFLLLAIAQAVINQDGGSLFRTMAYVPIAALGTGAGVVVVDMLVRITDSLSAWIGQSLGADLTAFTTGLSTAVLAMSLPVGGSAATFAGLMAAGMVAFTAFAIWIELMLRQAAIYVAVLFLPLAFMALVWPATAHWLRRLVQGLVAIILSKFVIMAVMALAATALDSDVDEEGFATVVSGGALLLLAALAPYVLLRLIPVFEAGLSSQLEGTVRQPTASVSPQQGSQIARMVRSRMSHESGGAESPDGTQATSSAGHREHDSAGAATTTSTGQTPDDTGATATADSTAGADAAPAAADASGGGGGAAAAGSAGGGGAASGGSAAGGAGGAAVAAFSAGVSGARAAGAAASDRGGRVADVATPDEPSDAGADRQSRSQEGAHPSPTPPAPKPIPQPTTPETDGVVTDGQADP